VTPTEQLKHEHQIILLVLKGAEAEADHIQETGEVDKAKIGKLVDFFRNFVDLCHHTKEEKHLFQRMCCSVPQADRPVSVMLQEHEEGRRKVAALAEALAQSGAKAARAVHDILLAYAALLRQHIAKEDNILYPMADNGLDSQDQQKLSEAFEKVESEEMGKGVHEKYHRLAHELAGQS